MTTSADVANRAARARQKNADVRRAAGQDGFVLDPSKLPPAGLPTDRVCPFLAFVVYGIPAPQGSKRAFTSNGVARMKESSAGVDPWRQSVRLMVQKVIRNWNSTHAEKWEPLNEPVIASATVTLPGTDAAAKRGDRYASVPPDMDKLQRAIGDAISPVPVEPSIGKGMAPKMKKQVRDQVAASRAAQALLLDDSRIVGWTECTKVYPAATPSALGFPGVLIRLWRLSDLEGFALGGVGRDGVSTVGDIRTHYTPTNGWANITAAANTDPTATITVNTDGTLPNPSAEQIAALLIHHGPDHKVTVTAH